MTVFKPEVEEKELDQLMREAEGHQFELELEQPEPQKEIPIYCDCEHEACPHCG